MMFCILHDWSKWYQHRNWPIDWQERHCEKCNKKVCRAI